MGGITKSLPDDDRNPSSLVGKLKEWFPNCRCIVYNLLTSKKSFTVKNEFIEEQAKLLLDKVSTDLDVEYGDGSLGKNKALASPGLVFLGHDIGGSLIMKVIVLAVCNV